MWGEAAFERARREAKPALLVLTARWCHACHRMDEDTWDDIMGLLEQLWRNSGMTLVLVTHDSAVARRAQRIGIMQHGKLSIRQDTRGAAT